MRSCFIAMMFAAIFSPLSHAQEVPSLLATIKAVGKEGTGNPEAAKAWKQLSQQGPDALPEILTALDDANPAASNWIRGAVDAIAERTLQAGKPLPAAKLESFVRDTRRDGRARRLAYEWLVRVDAAAADRLIPGMLNDPSQELRRDAVALHLKAANEQLEKDKDGAKATFKKIFDAARDRDQVNLVADKLSKLGVDVDLVGHYGFITRWSLVGPFNNVKGVGFNTANPPEQGVDLAATYPGKEGMKVNWKEHTTAEKLGLVDFNKAAAPLKGATYFAFTAVSVPEERQAEIRCGSNNAIRIFLNGKEIYNREEYHHGFQMDQHSAKVKLKAGRNEILVKVLQNEQTDSWAQQWSFQLRVCDSLGAAIPYTVLLDSKK